MTSIFDQCFAIVVNTEGSLSMVPGDPGNWTGGKVGVGKLNGTKWGISAAAYPDLYIAGLTIANAKMIYQNDYWSRILGDLLPPPLALIVFDSAVNSGDTRAEEWLQTALGLPADGVIGPATRAAISAIRAVDVIPICTEALAQRIKFDASLAIWQADALGLSRRLAALPFHAMTLYTQPEQST